MHIATFKRSAAIAIAGFALNFGFMLFLVLGSGVLPASLRALCVIASAISAVTTLLSAFIKRRRSLLVANLLVFGVFVSGWAFMRSFSVGLEEAKVYARALAHEIDAVRQVSGKWPQTLDEVPAERQPPVGTASWWSAGVGVTGKTHRVVNGFIVVYKVDQQAPRLAVGRRDMIFTWDWQTSRWEEGDAK